MSAARSCTYVVATPLNFEQAGCSFIEGLARDATRFGSRPCASSETSLDVFFLVIIAALGRKPFGTVPEVMLAMFWCNEIVDGITGKCYIGRVRIHLAILVERSLDVSTIETAHSISTIYFDDECDVECKTVTNRLRMKWLLTMATYLSTKS